MSSGFFPNSNDYIFPANIIPAMNFLILSLSLCVCGCVCVCQINVLIFECAFLSLALSLSRTRARSQVQLIQAMQQKAARTLSPKGEAKGQLTSLEQVKITN